MGLLSRLYPSSPRRGFRIYYTGDLHGSELCFRKFLRAPSFYDADAAVLGGDITGKVMVPIVDEGGGNHSVRFQSREQVVPTEDLEKLEEQIRFNGFYPYRCEPAEVERMQADDAYRSSVFSDLMVEQVRRWADMAAERNAVDGTPFLIMPGNDDEFAIDEALDRDGVVNPDERVVELGHLQVLSSAWANPTPWNSPREESEEALTSRLDRIAASLDADRPTLFNLHCPPYDTTLDRAPILTVDLKAVSDGGEPRLGPVGSRAVRGLIERVQPVASMHGHIHESRGVTKIGSTVCVNPGSQYSEGRIDGAVLEIDGSRVVSCQLVSG